MSGEDFERGESDEHEEHDPKNCDCFYALTVSSCAWVYSMLYERKICSPPMEEILDEIERREMYPHGRRSIPGLMKEMDAVTDGMRQFLIVTAGEAEILKLEKSVEVMIERMKKEK